MSLQAPDFDCNKSHNKGQFYTLISKACCIKVGSKKAHSLCQHFSLHWLFHCGLYCRAVSVTDNLCIKQGNSQNPRFIIKSGFRSRASYNGAHTIKVTQIWNNFFKPTFLPKNKRTNSTLLPVDLFSFVIWKKVKTPKRHFEINWLLKINIPKKIFEFRELV